MEIAVSQLIKWVPDLANTLREEIRSGRLEVKRRTGMAGRPYVVELDTLAASPNELLQRLAERAQTWVNSPVPRRGKRSMGDLHLGRDIPENPSIEVWSPLIKLMESQYGMLRNLVEAMSQEMGLRNEQLSQRSREVQELSYKLGQAHQEISRLERELANHNFARAE